MIEDLHRRAARTLNPGDALLEGCERVGDRVCLGLHLQGAKPLGDVLLGVAQIGEIAAPAFLNLFNAGG